MVRYDTKFYAAMTALFGALLGAYFHASIYDFVRSPVSAFQGWVSSGETDQLQDRLEFEVDDGAWARGELGSPQAVNFGRFNKRIDRLFDGRNNFQLVQDLPETARAQRLARGVGRIEVRHGKKVIPCTGSLISETHVLTAGHCFYDYDTRKPITGAAVKIRLNKLDRDNSDDTVELQLELPPQAEDGTFQNSAEGLAVIYAPDGGRALDYAILKIRDGDVACARADADPEDVTARQTCLSALAERAGLDMPLPCKDMKDKLNSADYDLCKRATDTKARGLSPQPVELGKVDLEPKHELLILHHPSGKELVLTQRYCQAQIPVLKDGETPKPDLWFNHLCDTLGGSSGAPVFSLDHDVVVGIHVCCAQTNPSQTNGLNAAVKIEEVGNESDPVAVATSRNPLTINQQRILDHVRERSQAALDSAVKGNKTLARWLVRDAAIALLKTEKNERILSHDGTFHSAVLAARQTGSSGFQEVASFHKPSLEYVRIVSSPDMENGGVLIQHKQHYSDTTYSKLNISNNEIELKDIIQITQADPRGVDDAVDLHIDPAGTYAVLAPRRLSQPVRFYNLADSSTAVQLYDLPGLNEDIKGNSKRVTLGAAFVDQSLDFCVFSGDNTVERSAHLSASLVSYLACSEAGRLRELRVQEHERVLLSAQNWKFDAKIEGLKFTPESLSRTAISFHRNSDTAFKIVSLSNQQTNGVISRTDIERLAAQVFANDEIPKSLMDRSPYDSDFSAADSTIIEPTTMGIATGPRQIEFGARVLSNNTQYSKSADGILSAEILVQLEWKEGGIQETHISYAPARRYDRGGADWKILFAERIKGDTDDLLDLEYAINYDRLINFAYGSAEETASSPEMILREKLSDPGEFGRAGTWPSAGDVHSDRQELALGYPDGEIWLWSLETGLLIDKLNTHGSAVSQLFYSPSGDNLLSLDQSAYFRLWARGLKQNQPNARRNELTRLSNAGDAADTTASDLSPVARIAPGLQPTYAALYSNRAYDPTNASRTPAELKVINISTGDVDAQLQLSSESDSFILDASVDPRGRLGAFLLADSIQFVGGTFAPVQNDTSGPSTRGWWNEISDTLANRQTARVKLDQFDLTSANWSPDGSLFALSTSHFERQGQVAIFDTKTGDCLWSVSTGTAGADVRFGPYGEIMAVGSENGFSIWDLQDRSVMYGQQFGGLNYTHRGTAGKLPDHSYSDECTFSANDEVDTSIGYGDLKGAWVDAEFSSDRSTFAISKGGYIHVTFLECSTDFGLLCKRRKRPIAINSGGFAKDLALNADGSRLAVLSEHEEVRVIDLNTETAMSNKSFSAFGASRVELDTTGSNVIVFTNSELGFEIYSADTRTQIWNAPSTQIDRIALIDDKILAFYDDAPVELLNTRPAKLLDLANESISPTPDPSDCVFYSLEC